MTASEIQEAVATRLPRRYEPLNLTFYGRECEPDGEYLIIGYDYGTNFCVAFTDGSIYAIDPRGRLDTRFMNSGVEQLAKFIETCDSLPPAADRPPEVLARELREALEPVDPKAFADPENWWAVVVEQVGYGL